MEGYVFQTEPKGGLKRLRIGRGLQPRCWPEGAAQEVSHMRHRVPVREVWQHHYSPYLS
jgi:hypothetical protein